MLFIWALGPSFTWQGRPLLASPEKRLYCMAFVFFAWALLWLAIDRDAFASPQHLVFKEKLRTLKQHFSGAIRFQKETAIVRQGIVFKLQQLPWILLIGPVDAGKTSLLSRANVKFILQRQAQQSSPKEGRPTQICDWWMTKDVTFIDVPGKYMRPQGIKFPGQTTSAGPVFWQTLLRLIKKYRGKKGLYGVIVALPLPEFIKDLRAKKYEAMVFEMIKRLKELSLVFPYPVPCYLMVTKCDLVPGFLEFFADLGTEELVQAWGVSLTGPETNDPEKVYQIFVQQFNALIKKLNQQLIWRLHQERNTLARLLIKDFPLEMERIKEGLLDVIKKIHSAKLNILLKGAYLTSALQHPNKLEDKISEEKATQVVEKVHVFQMPLQSDRAYFIKQLLVQGILPPQEGPLAFPLSPTWQRYAIYASSMALIGSVAFILGQDFKQGVRKAYSVQQILSEYQLATQRKIGPDTHLIKTIDLLDALQDRATNRRPPLSISYLRSFYSHVAQQKTSLAYAHALQTILLPEVKYYFEAFLGLPVNSPQDLVYAVLKSYLMMGDLRYLRPEEVVETLQRILPKTMDHTYRVHIAKHLALALGAMQDGLALNLKVVQQTRKFLIALPSLQLSYILLKNMDNNLGETKINLGTHVRNAPFILGRPEAEHIMTMYTAKAFAHVFSQHALGAAQESTVGNWVLGTEPRFLQGPNGATGLVEQLRTAYVNNYVEVWEKLLANVHLALPTDLNGLDAMLVKLIDVDSPLLQFLQAMYDNTYFEPVTLVSPKLQQLGMLIDKNKDETNGLKQIFSSLRVLHQYVNTILNAEDPRKAAFEAVSKRMLNQSVPDPLTQLRLVADQSPPPLNHWLSKIADHASHFLIVEASRYMDTSWQEQVVQVYKTELASRYPFSTHTKKEVPLAAFANFFGNPGTMLNFYHHYLQAFIDDGMPIWRWKDVDGKKLPFSDETLRQVQQALQIHHAFFPDDDNKLYANFTLQPYKLGKQIQKVRLNVNEKEIITDHHDQHGQYAFSWPGTGLSQLTSVQIALSSQKSILQEYHGDWGWFKLLNQSFESMITNKELLINLSANAHPVKYLLFTEEKFNPLLALNLRHFYLPQHVVENVP